MRLSTAQELSFQDLANICLPFIAQAEVERCLMSGNSCDDIRNVNQFISYTIPRVAREQLNNLLNKISEAEIFLVYPFIDMAQSIRLVSLKNNLEVGQDKKGLKVEHWQIHPQLSGLAKFNAELLIQRLTYQERVYGTAHLNQKKYLLEQEVQAPKRRSLSELSDSIDRASPVDTVQKDKA